MFLGIKVAANPDEDYHIHLAALRYSQTRPDPLETIHEVSDIVTEAEHHMFNVRAEDGEWR